MLEPEAVFLDHIPNPILILKVSELGALIVEKANTAYEKSTGLCVEKLQGKEYSETVDQTLNEVMQSRHQEAIQSKQPIVFEHRIPFAKHPKTTKTTITPVIGTAGDVEWLVCSSIDQMPATDSTPSDYNAMTQKDAETFISMAAHDLRTPMRNVKTLAQILLAEPETRGEKELRVLKILENLADSTSTLISDLLAHSNALNGTGEITSFNLGDLGRNLVKSVDPLENHKILFESGWIQGNETAFRIILHNILCEAIENAEPNAVDLSVGLDAMVEQNVALISITAKGKAFTDPLLNFLSGAEMRTENSFRMLGVRRLVRSSGGSITGFRNMDTGGTVVRFKLPGQVNFATADPMVRGSRFSLRHANHSMPQVCPNPGSR